MQGSPDIPDIWLARRLAEIRQLLLPRQELRRTIDNQGFEITLAIHVTTFAVGLGMDPRDITIIRCLGSTMFDAVDASARGHGAETFKTQAGTLRSYDDIIADMALEPFVDLYRNRLASLSN